MPLRDAAMPLPGLIVSREVQTALMPTAESAKIPSMIKSLAITVTVLSLLMLSACTSEPQRKAAETNAVRKDVAEEVERICALSEPARDAALAKLSEEF